jgi:hypothetical protein
MGQLKGTGVQSEGSAPAAETGSSSMANSGGTLAGRLHLVVCAAGIIASLMLYSVLQVQTWSASHTGRASCYLTLAKCSLRSWASQSFAPPCISWCSSAAVRLQERIMTQPYGESGEFFTISLFLVLCNRVLTVVLAFGLLLVPSPAWPSTPASTASVP